MRARNPIGDPKRHLHARADRRTLAPYLSKETMAHPGFNLFDVRIYNGDVEAKTGLHTDLRPSLDADGMRTATPRRRSCKNLERTS